MKKETGFSISFVQKMRKVLSVWLIFAMLLSPLETFAASLGNDLHIQSNISLKRKKKSLFSNDISTAGLLGNELLGNIDAENYIAQDEDIMLGNFLQTNVVTREALYVQVSQLQQFPNVLNQDSVNWSNMAKVASVGGNSSTDFNSLLKGYVSWPEARETYAPLAGAEFTGKVKTTNHGIAEDAFEDYELITKKWVIANTGTTIGNVTKPMLEDMMTFDDSLNKYKVDGLITSSGKEAKHVVTGETVFNYVAPINARVIQNKTAIEAEAERATAAEQANADAISANTELINTNKVNIATNAANISANTTAIEKNVSDIAANKTAITAEETRAKGAEAANESAIEAEVTRATAAEQANADAIEANKGDIAQNASDIAQNASDIATNVTDIATNKANIATNADAIAANTTAIADKADKATTLAGYGITDAVNVSQLQAAVGSAYIDPGATGTRGDGLYYDSANSKLVSNVALELSNGVNKINLSNGGDITVSNNGKTSFSLTNLGNATLGIGGAHSQITLNAVSGAITVKKVNGSDYIFNLTNKGNLMIGGMLSSTSKSDDSADILELRTHEFTDTTTSIKTRYGTVLKNVEAGSADTDAVNVKQLKSAVASGYTAGDGITFTAGTDVGDPTTVSVKLATEAVESATKNISGLKIGGDNNGLMVKVKSNSGITLDGDGLSLNADTTDFQFSSSDATKGRLQLQKDGAVASGNTGVVTGGTVYATLSRAIGNAFTDAGATNTGLYYDATNSKLVSNVPFEATNGTNKITLSNDGKITVNNGVKTSFSLSNLGSATFGNGTTSAQIKLEASTGAITVKGANATSYLFNLNNLGNLTLAGTLTVNGSSTTLQALTAKSGTFSGNVIVGSKTNPLTLSATDGKIINLVAGTENTDAVNVGQLKAAVGNAFVDAGVAGKGLYYDSTNENLVANVPFLGTTATFSGNVSGSSGEIVSGNTNFVTGGEVYNSLAKFKLGENNYVAIKEIELNGLYGRINNGVLTISTSELEPVLMSFAALSTDETDTPTDAENDTTGETSTDTTDAPLMASAPKRMMMSARPATTVTTTENTESTNDTTDKAVSETTDTIETTDTATETPSMASAPKMMMMMMTSTPPVTSTPSVTTPNEASSAPNVVAPQMQNDLGGSTPLGEINAADLKGQTVTDTAVHNYVTNYVNDTIPQISYTDVGGTIQTESMSDGTLAAGNNLRITKDSESAKTYNIELKDEISGVKSIELTEEAPIDIGSKKVATVGQVASVTKDVQSTLSNVNKVLNDTNVRINEVETRSNQVGAHAAALSSLHPLPYNPDAPTSFAAGVGTYRDETSYAIGVFHYTSDRFMFNLGASVTKGADVMGRAGLSFSLGRGGKSAKTARKEAQQMQGTLADIVKGYSDMNNQHAMLASQQQKLTKRNHELEAANEENTKRIQQLEEELAIMKEYIESKKKEEEERKRKEEDAKKKNAKNVKNGKKSNSKKK